MLKFCCEATALEMVIQSLRIANTSKLVKLCIALINVIFCEDCSFSFYFSFELGVTSRHWRLVSYSVLFCLFFLINFVSLAGVAFTKDGRYMAVAERRDCKDFISIFVCSDWQLLRVRCVLAFRCFCIDSKHVLHAASDSVTLIVWFLTCQCSIWLLCRPAGILP